MKTYTVKQVAKMLGTQPETVRRWIRDEKLKATQNSKKEGNVIAEDDLFRFVESAPKYSSLLLAAISAGPVIGIPLAAAGGAAVLAYETKQKRKESNINEKDLESFLKRAIETSNSVILQKRQEIELAEQTIAAEESRVKEWTSLLDDLLDKD